MTERELRSLIDREVSKALKTRTSNLEKEKQELQGEIERLRKAASEAGMDVTEKLRAREAELANVATQLKTIQKTQEVVLTEIAQLVEAEANSLSTEDRMLIDSIVTDDMSPIVRLRLIMALRRAGKIGGTPADQNTRTVGNVGTPMRPTATTEVRGTKAEPKTQRLWELGKKLAQRKNREVGYVPPQWQKT